MCRNNQLEYIFSEKELYPRARELFFLMAGFSEKNPPSIYQEEEIFLVQQAIASKLHIVMEAKKIQHYEFYSRYMILEEERFEYNIPLQSYKEQITGVYAYFVSSKEIDITEQNVARQLYGDIWQNAYLDAAREASREMLRLYTGHVVSQGMAPGFYGIPVENISNLFRLLDTKRAGITLEEGGYMKPEKTVMGIYFTLRWDLNIFKRDCSNCFAKGKNCEFCMRKL